MLLDRDTAGKGHLWMVCVSLLYVQDKLFHTSMTATTNQGKKTGWHCLVFSSGVILSTSLLGPVLIAHLLCCIQFYHQTGQVMQWWIEEVFKSASEQPLPPTKAYCTVHSSLSSTWGQCRNKGDHSAKLQKLASSNEQWVTWWTPALKKYCKVGLQVLTHVIIFHDCFVLSVSLFLLVKTNIKGEYPVNVPHWKRQLWEEFCACQAKKNFENFCLIFIPIIQSAAERLLFEVLKKRKKTIMENSW